MPELIGVSIGSAAIVSLVAFVATGRRRRMARHPSPTFVFADLVGYTALTKSAATKWRRGSHGSSGARCARSAEPTAHRRSSRWATA